MPQVRPRFGPDDAVIGSILLARVGDEHADEFNFDLSCPIGKSSRRNAFRFAPLVNPRYKQHVSQPCLDRRRSGEQLIS